MINYDADVFREPEACPAIRRFHSQTCQLRVMDLNLRPMARNQAVDASVSDFGW